MYTVIFQNFQKWTYFLLPWQGSIAIWTVLNVGGRGRYAGRSGRQQTGVIGAVLLTTGQRYEVQRTQATVASFCCSQSSTTMRYTFVSFHYLLVFVSGTVTIVNSGCET